MILIRTSKRSDPDPKSRRVKAFLLIYINQSYLNVNYLDFYIKKTKFRVNFIRFDPVPDFFDDRSFFVRKRLQLKTESNHAATGYRKEGRPQGGFFPNS
mgnify:CR=1 FL=1